MTCVLASARQVRLLVLLILILTAIAACGGSESSDDQTPATQGAPSSISLRAGLNDPQDPNIAVLEFLPESVTVARGTKVAWQLKGPEPHSVTFFPPGQTPPPPGSDPKLFAPTPPKGALRRHDPCQLGPSSARTDAGLALPGLLRHPRHLPLPLRDPSPHDRDGHRGRAGRRGRPAEPDHRPR